jgi:hypothetical protein
MPSVTINTNRAGKANGISSTFSTARQTASSVNDGLFSSTNAIQAVFSAGRGGGTFSIIRSFFHFDVSAVTGTVTSVTLRVLGNTNTTSDVIVLKSTAFGGDGGTALSTSDYFSSIDYSTAYSAEITSWSTGVNSISLNGVAANDIQSNNDFTIALVNHSNDFSNSAGKGSSFSFIDGINASSAGNVRLEFTETASSNITSLNRIARSNITSFDTIALASITSINGVTN